MVAAAPQIVTNRLLLRQWDVDIDLDPWAALCADLEVMRFVGDEASAMVMRKIGIRLERETTHPGNGRAVRVYEIDRPPSG